MRRKEMKEKRGLGIVFVTIWMVLTFPGIIIAGLEEPQERGVYVVGGMNVGGQSVSFPGGESLSNAGVGAQIMGGYHFLDHFAVELGYSGINYASKLSFRGVPGNVLYWTHEIGPRILLKTNGAVDFYGFLTGGILIAQFRVVDPVTGAAAAPDKAYGGAYGGGGGGLLLHWGKGWFAGPEFSLTGHSYSVENVGVSGARYMGTFRIGYEWFL